MNNILYSFAVNLICKTLQYQENVTGCFSKRSVKHVLLPLFYFLVLVLGMYFWDAYQINEILIVDLYKTRDKKPNLT